MGYIGAGVTRFNTADGLTVSGDAQIDTNTLVVDSTNNRVGVGTASPTTALDVAGTVTADGLTVDSSTGITVNGPSSSDGKLNLVAYAGTQNAEARILAARGATSGTDSRLKFYTNNGTSLVQRVDIDDTGDISFYEDTGTTPKFFWDASAERLGLGTTSPTRTLSVERTGGSSVVGTFKRTDSASAYITFEGSTTTTDAHVGIGASGDDLFLRSNNAERMRIDSSGNVGIGESDPLVRLHIKDGNKAFDTYGNINVFTSDTSATDVGGLLRSAAKTHKVLLRMFLVKLKPQRKLEELGTGILRLAQHSQILLL